MDLRVGILGRRLDPGGDCPETAHPVMTSSIGNILRVTGNLCGEFTGQRGIPLTKASDAEL